MVIGVVTAEEPACTSDGATEVGSHSFSLLPFTSHSSAESRVPIYCWVMGERREIFLENGNPT